jgi:hypothetical protein
VHFASDRSQEWKILSPFRVQCRWPRPTAAGGVAAAGSGAVGAEGSAVAAFNRSRRQLKICLQLFQVQHGIHLMDFHNVAGDVFFFMNTCYQIIVKLQMGLGPGRSRSKRRKERSQVGAASSAPAGAGHARSAPGR